MVKGVTKHVLVENHYHQTIKWVKNNFFSIFMMNILKNIPSYGNPQPPPYPLYKGPRPLILFWWFTGTIMKKFKQKKKKLCFLI